MSDGENLEEEKIQQDQSGSDQRQRDIDFIVRQQALFVSDMHQLREAHERSEQRWTRTEEGIRSLLSIAEIHERDISTIAAAAAAQAAAHAAAQARTDAQMKETDERLNALVNVVERIIGERRNGQS